MGDKSSKRPFWMHQLVEYILGGALVGMGAQSPTPIVPAVLGGVVLLYSASTRGALCAFRLINRRVHRVIDPLIVALEVAGAVQPWIDVETSTRFVIGAIAVVHLFVWWGSSFAERPARTQRVAPNPANGDRSTELGRSAGRMVGSGVNLVRRARAKRQQ